MHHQSYAPSKLYTVHHQTYAPSDHCTIRYLHNMPFSEQCVHVDLSSMYMSVWAVCTCRFELCVHVELSSMYMLISAVDLSRMNMLIWAVYTQHFWDCLCLLIQFLVALINYAPLMIVIQLKSCLSQPLLDCGMSKGSPGHVDTCSQTCLEEFHRSQWNMQQLRCLSDVMEGADRYFCCQCHAGVFCFIHKMMIQI